MFASYLKQQTRVRMNKANHVSMHLCPFLSRTTGTLYEENNFSLFGDIFSGEESGNLDIVFLLSVIGQYSFKEYLLE